ncbi:unnamed protein product [Larinioides sclopetarius]|uniref:Uncharacterized protein n=1 Tax=Larinioides sclopetarius TaxID=280406 RepID=A0AAV2B2B5_9ARAC
MPRWNSSKAIDYNTCVVFHGGMDSSGNGLQLKNHLKLVEVVQFDCQKNTQPMVTRSLVYFLAASKNGLLVFC